MANTLSVMIPLGTIAPSFTLLDVTTQTMRSLAELKSDIATVIVFICNHCPFVKHIQTQLVDTAYLYQQKGVRFIAINANDITTYPEDSPAHMKKEAARLRYPFPYLFDETQAIARAYQAACTPDFYIFDKQLACVYRGRFDEATPRNQKPVTGADLRFALDCILENKPIPQNQQQSVGCNIKWKITHPASVVT